jgi:hypothetical protein
MNRYTKYNRAVTYKSQTTESNINIYFANETFWITQNQMSELFGCDIRVIFTALNELFEANILNRAVSNRQLQIRTQNEDVYRGNFYDFDALLAVGYRLNPKETTAIRLWANNQLKEYFQKIMKTHTVVGGLKRRLNSMIAA